MPNELITKHFHISNCGCILDLITDDQIIYIEFDNNHKIIDKCTCKRPTIDELVEAYMNQLIESYK